MDFAKNYPIMTSRGCPYNCIFCCVGKTSGKKWRTRDIKEVIKEIEYAKRKFNIKSFCVFDDNFTMDMERAKEFCKMLKEINLPWCAVNCRADKVDYELLKNIKESGCEFVHFGIESADPDVFKGIEKGETLEQIEKAIHLAKKAGLKVGGSFIIGLPNSTYESEMKSLAFAKKNKIDFVEFYPLQILKGAKIWEWLRNQRYLIIPKWGG